MTMSSAPLSIRPPEMRDRPALLAGAERRRGRGAQSRPAVEVVLGEGVLQPVQPVRLEGAGHGDGVAGRPAGPGDDVDDDLGVVADRLTNGPDDRDVALRSRPKAIERSWPQPPLSTP